MSLGFFATDTLDETEKTGRHFKAEQYLITGLAASVLRTRELSDLGGDSFCLVRV